MKEIAIIGAGGRMGSWFTKYFVNNKNFRIKVYDTKYVLNSETIKGKNRN